MSTELENALQSVLISVQQGNHDSTQCKRNLIKAVGMVYDIPFNMVQQALRALISESAVSATGASSAATMSLTEQAEQLIKDLEIAHDKNKSEVDRLQEELQKRIKEAQDQLHQFKKAEKALREADEAINLSLQTRRAHQQAIQGAIQGISYSQMITLHADESQKRLNELDTQLESLLEEADTILRESITKRLAQISDVRRQIAQSATVH